MAGAALKKMEPLSYSRCVNCGKYIQTSLKEKTLYCCNECVLMYAECGVCGRYYLKESNHFDSLKCLVKFDVNKKGMPYIRQTMLKLLVTGNPLSEIELLAERLSVVLKLPLFVSEQFRIEESLEPDKIREHIEAKLKSENLPDFYIFLLNTYNPDFIGELSSKLTFDRFVIVDKDNECCFCRHNSSGINSNLTHAAAAVPLVKNMICTNCGNINCFSKPDFEGNIGCLVCGNKYFTTSEYEATAGQKIKNYQDCVKYIDNNFSGKCLFFETGETRETVNRITQFLIYT